MEKGKLPKGYWNFIVEYLPNYSSRDDVLVSDIYTRYLNGGDVLDSDIEYLFKGKTWEQIEEEYYNNDLDLLLEAIEAYCKKKYKE